MSETTATSESNPQAEAKGASGLSSKQVKRRVARIQAMDGKKARQSHYRLMRKVLEAIADGSAKSPKRVAAAVLMPVAEAGTTVAEGTDAA